MILPRLQVSGLSAKHLARNALHHVDQYERALMGARHGDGVLENELVGRLILQAAPDALIPGLRQSAQASNFCHRHQAAPTAHPGAKDKPQEETTETSRHC